MEFYSRRIRTRKIAEILNRIKTSRSIEYGFADALGLTIEELSERWEQHLKERYFPEVAQREMQKVSPH